ncbi:DUF4328 domain-containing protein [Streptomyces olivaceiscleroticus]|uniref:DUF4328 domain-containing protein n=1 Tax=Streptomyces olivaceiscleroticus TaxID=68245 RepID=UPI0031F91896
MRTFVWRRTVDTYTCVPANEDISGGGATEGGGRAGALVSPVRWTAQKGVSGSGYTSALAAADENYAFYRSLSVQVLPVAAVVFIVRFHRTRINGEILAPEGHRRGRLWAVGAWFTPIVALWFPRQIAGDTWKASSAPGSRVSSAVVNGPRRPRPAHRKGTGSAPPSAILRTPRPGGPHNGPARRMSPPPACAWARGCGPPRSGTPAPAHHTECRPVRRPTAGRGE